MKRSQPPGIHRQFVRRFQKIGRAWELVSEEAGAGPLDARAQRLAKLAVAIGAQRKSAVHSAVRKARDAGVTLDEMEQLAALAASTIGFPATVAAWSWIKEEAPRSRGTRARSGSQA